MSTTKSRIESLLARSDDGADHEVHVYRITNTYQQMGGTGRVSCKLFETSEAMRLTFVSPGILSLGDLMLRSEHPMAQSQEF